MTDLLANWFQFPVRVPPALVQRLHRSRTCCSSGSLAVPGLCSRVAEAPGANTATPFVMPGPVPEDHLSPLQSVEGIRVQRSVAARAVDVLPEAARFDVQRLHLQILGALPRARSDELRSVRRANVLRAQRMGNAPTTIKCRRLAALGQLPGESLDEVAQPFCVTGRLASASIATWAPDS